MTGGEARRGIAKLVDKPPRDTGDVIWIVRCMCGVKVGWTKMSKKPASRDIGSNLESLMARQLSVSVADWREIAGCRMGRADYLELRAHGHR